MMGTREEAEIRIQGAQQEIRMAFPCLGMETGYQGRRHSRLFDRTQGMIPVSCGTT